MLRRANLLMANAGIRIERRDWPLVRKEYIQELCGVRNIEGVRSPQALLRHANNKHLSVLKADANVKR